MGSWSGGGEGREGGNQGYVAAQRLKMATLRRNQLDSLIPLGLWGEASSDSAPAVNYAPIAAGRETSVRGRKPTKAPPGVVSPPRLFRRLILP